ncbi:CAP10 domain-containing protein [Mycena kentingensis (nom. inval.)]|nr:CAP10 domain-containing protein [Mycena kentingensis (nom. inval.)]
MSSSYSPLPSTPHSVGGRFRSRFSRRRWGTPVLVGGVVGFLLLVAIVGKLFWGGEDDDLPPTPPPPKMPDTQHDLPNPSDSTPAHLRTAVDDLFERQPQTLEQATARYRLKNGRSPPRGYDRWFRTAKKNHCLVDDYDQLYRDFAPFYQLAAEKGKERFFGQMVEAAAKMIHEENFGLRAFTVEGGKVDSADEWSSNYDELWLNLLKNVSSSLPGPSSKFIINHRDEPRVVFDVRALNADELALKPQDETPFRNQPKPTSKFYTEQKHCLAPTDDKGFLKYANDASSFLLYSASSDVTTDLYPVLSQSKIYPCFADILFPSAFHYTSSYWHPKYAFPDNVAWADKKPVLYWRGQSTGGWISGNNYHSFPRFKLLDIAREPANAPLMDVAISAFYEHFCQLDGCDAGKIKAEYGIPASPQGAPREDGYGYKYVLDVDGNAFSGRYLGLLTSGSLVFKSTLFTEYFDGWLRPFEHYLPVRPDLSDLVERIEWARANDDEARRIQKAGKEFVERVITDAQNDCYFHLVLLEWARLQGGGH